MSTSSWSGYKSLCWAAMRVAAYVEGALDECGLTPPQYRMLVAIAHGPISSAELAKRIGVTAPSVTSMVRGLERRGAVSRTASVEDQRRMWLNVTPEGAKLLEDAESNTRARLEAIAAEFDDQSQADAALASLKSWNPVLDRFRADWLETHPISRRNVAAPESRLR
ncbi:MAG TPA: MarR family transcriptional regulator [Acidimicrobiales bacterium]